MNVCGYAAVNGGTHCIIKDTNECYVCHKIIDKNPKMWDEQPAKEMNLPTDKSSKSKKKHCMFQCWLMKESPFGYGQGYLVEDTDLITFKKAVELWEKYKPKVIEQLENGQDIEMCIWTGCEDEFSYSADSFHVNSNTETENGEFIEIKKSVIDPSKVIMGEPVFAKSALNIEELKK